jgi:gluconokinase
MLELPADGWVVLVMGVAGSGKTTIGRGLAAALDVRFFDADDFHSAENIGKMARGEALGDADRAPWLAALRARIEDVLAAHGCAVLACSALKRAYRQQLRVDAQRVRVVFLNGSPELIAARLRERPGHFAHESLLGSQLAALEPPKDALEVDVAATPAEIVRTILDQLRLAPAS